jgi:hypothetical protein
LVAEGSKKERHTTSGRRKQNAVPCVAYEVVADTSYTTFFRLRRPEKQMPEEIALFCYAWMEAPQALGRDTVPL